MAEPIRRLAIRFAVVVAPLVIAMAAFAEPAFSAGVTGKVLEQRHFVEGSSEDAIDIHCPPGFLVVGGYVVATSERVRVFESRRHSDRAWRFSVINFGSNIGLIKVEVLCVRISEEEEARARAKLRLEASDREFGVLEPGESADVRVDCPGGHAPVGWGYRETDDGSGNQPPPMGADSRIATAKPVRGGMRFVVENTGSEAYREALRLVCVDRRSRAGDEVVLTQTVRETTKFEIPALDVEIVRARCAGDGVAVGAGWALPEQTPLFPLPLGWNGDSRFGTGFANASSLPEQGKAYQLCLNAAVM